MVLAAQDVSLTLKDLLNPTSGRDASHPCFISLELKEGCTHEVVLQVIKSKKLRLVRVRPAPRAANTKEDNTF